MAFELNNEDKDRIKDDYNRSTAKQGIYGRIKNDGNKMTEREYISWFKCVCRDCCIIYGHYEYINFQNYLKIIYDNEFKDLIIIVPDDYVEPKPEEKGIKIPYPPDFIDGFVVYIFFMLLVSVFNENWYGWIMITFFFIIWCINDINKYK